MKKKLIESTLLKAVSYDERTQALEIEFADNSVYQYAKVPKSTYEGLMKAKSKGGYFNSKIVSGGYQITHIQGDPPPPGRVGLAGLPTEKTLGKRRKKK